MECGSGGTQEPDDAVAVADAARVRAEPARVTHRHRRDEEETSSRAQAVVVVLGGSVVTALVLTALIVGVSLDVPEPTPARAVERTDPQLEATEPHRTYRRATHEDDHLPAHEPQRGQRVAQLVQQRQRSREHAGRQAVRDDRVPDPAQLAADF
jgi:hypothetical protein